MEENKEDTKIAICIPWDSPFMFTVAGFNMMNWEQPKDCKVRFIMGVGWCPAARHNDAVAKAQEWGANLIMFNGGDHLCDFDIMVRMKNRIDEGWDMVHAMPPSRGVCGFEGPPFRAQSFKVIGPIPKEDYITHFPKQSVEVISYENDPQQTHIAGTGNLMMKAQIFDGLEKPYFEEYIRKDGRFSRYPVQDSRFTSRCTIESGARMLCDTSIRVVHLDIFGIDDTFQERFKDKTGQMDWCPAKDLRKFI